MSSRRIEVEIVGDSRQLERAFGRAQSATQRFGRGLQRTGASLTRGVTLPIVGLGVAAGKMGLDFGKAMTNIRALVGASDKQMASYQKGVLDLAKTVPQGPQALAEALYFVTSAGFAGKEALDVLNASAKAAAAGLGDTMQVADAVTSAVNAYGISNLSAAKATDVLLAAVREGKAEPEELAQAIGRVIAPAEAMGVAFGEVGGAIAALSLGGLDAAESVTALRGVLASFLKPSKQATEFLEQNGMSMQELRRQIDDKGLLSVLQMLRNRFGDNQEALAKLFPNVRALNGFLALTGQNAEKNAKVMEEVTSAVGDTNRAFAEASEDARFRLERAWSQVQVAMINASAVLLPIVGKIATRIAQLASWFDRLSPRAQKTILVMAGVAAALGPVISLVGKLVIAVKALSVALMFLAANPVGAVIIGIAALAAGLVIAYRRSETFRNIVNSVFGALQRMTAAVGGVRNAVIILGSTLAPVIGSIARLVGWANQAIGALRGLASAVRSVPSLPDLSPGFDVPGIPGFQHGGVVPGPRGAPRLAMVHGGETILPTHKSGGGGAGYPAQINVYIGDRKIESFLVDLNQRSQRRNGGRGFLER